MVFRIGCFLVGGETAEMVPMWHVLPGDPQDRAFGYDHMPVDVDMYHRRPQSSQRVLDSSTCVPATPRYVSTTDSAYGNNDPTTQVSGCAINRIRSHGFRRPMPGRSRPGQSPQVTLFVTRKFTYER